MDDDGADRRRDRRERVDPPSWAPVPDPTVLSTEQVEREIGHVKELFGSQFQLIERQRVESKIDTEKALAAALTAPEKAAQVLATFTSDQLKALQASFTTAFEQIRKDIAELKENNRGTQGVRQGGREAYAGLYALAGFLVSLLVLGGFIFALVPRK
jgi:hypothetical protein